MAPALRTPTGTPPTPIGPPAPIPINYTDGVAVAFSQTNAANGNAADDAADGHSCRHDVPCFGHFQQQRRELCCRWRSHRRQRQPVLSGNHNVTLTNDNTYTGGTTINSGAILQLGNNTTTGSVTGNIVNNGTLDVYHTNAYTFSGNMTGAGTIDLGTTTFRRKAAASPGWEPPNKITAPMSHGTSMEMSGYRPSIWQPETREHMAKRTPP